MKIELETQDVQAIAEKVLEIAATSRAQGRAHFQAQALYSLDRQGNTEANCIYRAIKGTVQA